MTVIDNARQTVAAPVRKPRRYGIFSVVTPHDAGDAHWIMGGLTADGEECSKPLAGEITCGPTAQPKSARSWYSDLEGDPWVTYMYETCKTVGRFDEAQSRLRTRFLAAEQSAVENGLKLNVFAGAPTISNSGETIASLIGALEAEAAAEYGGQIILHMGPTAGAEAARFNLLHPVGDHLETVSGNLVSIGNYEGAGLSGTVTATGALELYRSSLVEVPPQYGFNNNENDYYALIERAYAAVIDCYLMTGTVSLCGCGGTSGPM